MEPAHNRASSIRHTYEGLKKGSFTVMYDHEGGNGLIEFYESYQNTTDVCFFIQPGLECVNDKIVYLL